MKLLKLSMVAMMAMGTASFAADMKTADTLAEAFANGKTSGELKAYYFSEDEGIESASDTAETISVLGVKLDYKTAKFYGFNADLGFQSSHTLYSNTDSETRFKKDMDADGAVLSSASLSYAMAKSSVKIGRQYIGMPLLAGSGSRLIRQAFQGAYAVSKDIKDTTIMGAYVTRYQNRTDEAGGVGQFEILGDDIDYVYAVAVKNKSLANTTLNLAYGAKENVYSIVYATAKYAGKVDKIGYDVSAQYNNTSYDSDYATTKSYEDASVYGVKAGGSISDFNAYIAYAGVMGDSTTTTTATASTGQGSGNAGNIYTSRIMNAGTYAESQQYAVNLGYKSKDLGVTVKARYVFIDLESDDEYKVMSLQGAYAFSGSLKGFGASLTFEQEEAKENTSTDKDNVWAKATYKF